MQKMLKFVINILNILLNNEQYIDYHYSKFFSLPFSEIIIELEPINAILDFDINTDFVCKLYSIKFTICRISIRLNLFPKKINNIISNFYKSYIINKL